MSAAPGDGVPPAGGTAVPVCPRHPSREAYVRCQRCERPTCPECQRPAAVGIQCVDCVKEGAKSVRTARTVFGGRAGVERPVVTPVIMGLCGVVYLLQLATAGAVTDRLQFWNPLVLTEPWRLLTAGFLHLSLLHIALNGYALWTIGPYLEGLLGRARFAALYLVSIVGGNVGFFVLSIPSGNPNASWWVQVVGASGGVFGLVAAAWVVDKRLNRQVASVAGVVAIYVLIDLLAFMGYGLLGRTAWQAHLVGALTGAALATALAYAPRERRGLLHPLAFAAMVVLLVVLVVVKAATVPAGLLA